jgi:chromosome partitioning protein
MEPRLKEVLAVVNNKGGVGKTTTVQSLAAAIVRNNKQARVLCVDLDPQCHLSILHGFDVNQYLQNPTVYDSLRKGGALPVYQSKRKGVYLVPASSDLQDVDSDLFRQMNPKKVLQKCFSQPVDDHTGDGLTDIISSFDYVLIDCPPALSQTTYNAMTVATGLLVPVQMEGLSVNGLGNIIIALREVQSELNPNLELRGLLPTMVDARPKIVRDFIDYLKRSYGDNVCETMIHRSVKMNEAQTMQKDIYDYRFGQWSKVANDYDALAKELFN